MEGRILLRFDTATAVINRCLVIGECRCEMSRARNCSNPIGSYVCELAAIVRALWRGGPGRLSVRRMPIMAGARVLQATTRVPWRARLQQIWTGSRKHNTKGN
jgi:hypothetical protein